MSDQHFVIPLEPQSRQRPRVTRFGTYTPRETRSAKVDVRCYLQAAGSTMHEAKVPVTLTVHFYVPRPKSAAKRVLFPVTRPDLDGYLSLVLDACTGVLWADDSQIISIHTCKLYDRTGLPHIELWTHEEV
jgi:Holliday junction resolvase RusA-like endonuclease